MRPGVERVSSFGRAARRLTLALRSTWLLMVCAIVTSAHAASCVGPVNALCFAPEHPASNERIDVTIVIGSVADGYYCLRNISRTIDGRRIRYDATFDDCGDKAGDPLVTILPLGPLPSGTYDVEIDAPTSPFAPDPASGPLSLRATLEVGEAIDSSAPIQYAIEYHRPSVDHYFVTAAATEINKLDRGELQGWIRTGESFAVRRADTSIGGSASPVCRFYGRPEAGLDSHFYSASPTECDAVRVRFARAWILESDDVFVVTLPDAATGVCPDETLPVYRLFNDRADVNHRLTTSFEARTTMIVAGWIPEGYGPRGVAMCVPVR